MLTQSRRKPYNGTPSLFLSFLLLAFLAAAYGTRPDALAALTYYPPWLGAGLGLLLLLGGWRRTNQSLGGLLLLLWIGYLFLCCDETVPVLRRLVYWIAPSAASPSSGTRLRVITLNCALGNPEAAQEVLPYHPDIVLLQESPGRAELEALAKRLFGKKAAVVRGYDTAILALGPLTERPIGRDELLFSAHALARLPNGSEIELVSLHLSTPTVRADFWNPDCWREQAEHHRLQRSQLETVVNRLRAVSATTPVLVAGDFNLPARDSIFRLFQSRLRDAFREAGRGWGDTITNDGPMLRIDQVWASNRFRALSAVAQKTVHSDHRMVVCDLFLSSPSFTHSPAAR